MDTEDKATRTAYDANPKRMVLVNADGIIEIDSARRKALSWTGRN